MLVDIGSPFRLQVHGARLGLRLAGVVRRDHVGDVVLRLLLELAGLARELRIRRSDLRLALLNPRSMCCRLDLHRVAGEPDDGDQRDDDSDLHADLR
jgi:hypothetical protein